VDVINIMPSIISRMCIRNSVVELLLDNIVLQSRADYFSFFFFFFFFFDRIFLQDPREFIGVGSTELEKPVVVMIFNGSSFYVLTLIYIVSIKKVLPHETQITRGL